MPRKQDEHLTLLILEMLQENYFCSKIARRLKTSRQATSEKLASMERMQLIKNMGGKPACYEIEPRGKVMLLRKKSHVKETSAPMKRKGINLTSEPMTDKDLDFHDFAVKIPILEHGELKKSKKYHLNNWVKEVLHENFPVPLTISITTKSAILQYHAAKLPRNTRFFSELFSHFVKGLMYANSYLHRNGYRLDISQAKVISQHIAAQANGKIADKIPDESVFSIKFARKAASLTNSMQQNASAWTDGTPDPRAIETNDLLYEEEMLLLMPEKVNNLERALVPILKGFARYNENIEKHLAVLDSMDRTLKAIRSKSIRRLKAAALEV